MSALAGLAGLAGFSGALTAAGAQSALSPAGEEAARVAVLAWVLFAGATAIMVFTGACAALAMFGPARWRRALRADRFVVGAGIVFPVVTLTVLLVYGLWTTRAGMTPQGGEEPVRISVIGEQWWWRVVYEAPDGTTFEGANEIRIPVGRRVEIALTTADVIHSFWVPALAGKLDMIPGRVNTLTLVATRPGVSRGQCAEYCGGAHALMSFHVLAQPEAEFEAWLEAAAGPAPAVEGAEAARGRALFLGEGCGGCHRVRGTPANGVIGPDLTRIGERLSLAAATLPNTREAMVRWLRDGRHVKPDNLMLDYGHLTEAEAGAIATWLEGLE